MDKYIVYKATGGLFHNLRGLTKAINIAIEKNNILIIDMDSHHAFGGNFNDYFNLELDAFGQDETVGLRMITDPSTYNTGQESSFWTVENGDGEYEITITATDEAFYEGDTVYTSTQNVTITVTDIFEWVAPVISSTSLGTNVTRSGNTFNVPQDIAEDASLICDLYP